MSLSPFFKFEAVVQSQYLLESIFSSPPMFCALLDYVIVSVWWRLGWRSISFGALGVRRSIPIPIFIAQYVTYVMLFDSIVVFTDGRSTGVIYSGFSHDFNVVLLQYHALRRVTSNSSVFNL